MNTTKKLKKIRAYAKYMQVMYPVQERERSLAEMGPDALGRLLARGALSSLLEVLKDMRPIGGGDRE
jgi:hypothetical protein